MALSGWKGRFEKSHSSIQEILYFIQIEDN